MKDEEQKLYTLKPTTTRSSLMKYFGIYGLKLYLPAWIGLIFIDIILTIIIVASNINEIPSEYIFTLWKVSLIVSLVLILICLFTSCLFLFTVPRDDYYYLEFFKNKMRLAGAVGRERQIIEIEYTNIKKIKKKQITKVKLREDYGDLFAPYCDRDCVYEIGLIDGIDVCSWDKRCLFYADLGDGEKFKEITKISIDG